MPDRFGSSPSGDRMKILILGASGILGQHMRLCAPSGITARYCRRQDDDLHHGTDLTDTNARQKLFGDWHPDVVVNLAGESNTDTVEAKPDAFRAINVEAPASIARWCEIFGAHYIHVSSQGVFSGAGAPYSPDSPCEPVNQYGRQKLEAERLVRNAGVAWTIVRPTFVLGVRPLPHTGRRNPVESMLARLEPRQVADRWFSPLFARDAAEELWRITLRRPVRETIHLGNPVTMSRYDVARQLGVAAEAVTHDSFQGLAPRPRDTTYFEGSSWQTDIPSGVARCRLDWEGKTTLDTAERAREIALFLSLGETECVDRLARGFHAAHADVAADFRSANPRDDHELLNWYRATSAYIWELSAYHCDAGFNYSGLCRGIADRLKSVGARRVLCLGDGIGDLTLTLRQHGMDATYHDLAGSRTAAFAHHRFRMRLGDSMPACRETKDWDPRPLLDSQPFDAVASLDFLEHVTDVPAWSRVIREALVPGGLFVAQNAFAIGSGANGSIPCHLERNDRYEREWAPLMNSLDMRQEGDIWWKKAI
jgi:dTDP-4-dehydrorhamnose reductase